MMLIKSQPELIPDPDGLAQCLSKTYALLAGSGISDLTATVQGGYPTIINIGCCPLISDPLVNLLT
jgi:hypothetical protein